uniref:Putative secreted protein n=1 Tax=Psorophora albipes TaxID=869069 RepID=T1DG34_9DIPT
MWFIFCLVCFMLSFLPRSPNVLFCFAFYYWISASASSFSLSVANVAAATQGRVATERIRRLTTTKMSFL